VYIDICYVADLIACVLTVYLSLLHLKSWILYYYKICFTAFLKEKLLSLAYLLCLGKFFLSNLLQVVQTKTKHNKRQSACMFLIHVRAFTWLFKVFLRNWKHNQASWYPATVRNIVICNLEFKQAVCVESICMFQNVFPFRNQVKLLFTFLVLLTKFIITRLLIYSFFWIWYFVTCDKRLQTSISFTPSNKCIPSVYGGIESLVFCV
jgi:hypothetical protein